MTKEKIKEALRCCKNQCCSYCPHWCEKGCQYQTLSDALDLITEQEKENDKLEQLNAIQCDAWQKLSDENERLVAENNSNLRHNAVLRKENKKLKEEIKQAQIEILGKLKERIETAINTYFNLDGGGYYLAEDVIDDIDDLIKEIDV